MFIATMCLDAILNQWFAWYLFRTALDGDFACSGFANMILYNTTKELSINKLCKIAAGFLSSCGAGKPQECLLPFKVLPRHMAAKRQGKMRKLFIDSS